MYSKCILTDPVNHIVLDILPKRYSTYLSSYFNDFTEKEREKVIYFVSDMWRPYFDICNTWCKNATKIVDKYHWIRLCIWAFDTVRKEEQKKFTTTHRQYFKRSKSLLIKRFAFLNDEQKSQVNIMLYASSNLSTAYYLKEYFLQILSSSDRKEAARALGKWILKLSPLPQFQTCGQSLANWSIKILNSFAHPITNG